MPKGSKALVNARRAEIVEACAQLYGSLPFKEITLGMIGAKTSFTRTSIYNYFRTKEEIFLALLEREYAVWTEDLLALAASPRPASEFPSAFAETLAGRRCMLKLLSMNLYDMEAGSRLESLVSFKRVYRDSLHAVGACLKAHFPRAGDEAVERFLYAFFPFLFGVYPYTEMTEKQKTAMKQAGVAYKEYTMSELIRAFTEMFSAFLSGGT